MLNRVEQYSYMQKNRKSRSKTLVVHFFFIILSCPLGHTERIQIGIFINDYARIVLDVMVAVIEIVDAVKSPEQLLHTTNGIKTIAPALAVAIIVLRDVMAYVRKKSDMEDFPFDTGALESTYCRRIRRAYMN